MTLPIPNQVYPVANAITGTRVFITVFETRNPTTADINYQPTQRWFNTANNEEWILVNFTTTSGVTTANWQPIASALTTETLTGNSGGPVGPDGSNNINILGNNASGVNVVGNPATHTLTIFNTNGLPVVGFTVDAFTAPGTDPVLPSASGLVTITGGQVAAGTTTNVIRTDSMAANTFTIQIQRSQAVASSTIGDNGVCHFNSAEFSVDANGFVSLISAATLSIVVDANTPPGTNPVVPTGAGQITITGGQVAAGTTANVIRTDSLAANTFTIQVQRSQAVATSTVGDNGVCHFNSTDFTVDANGFVSLITGALNYTNVTGPATYVVLSTDYYISCNPTAGAITLQFPNAPTFKQTWIIKDRTGSAAVNNISVTTPGGTVTFDGLTTYIMNSNYQAINLLANATPTYEVY